MNEYKKVLMKALIDGYTAHPSMPIYLQFSAGCDSVALFFAMLEMYDKYPFKCITYIYGQSRAFHKRIDGITTQYGVPLEKVHLTFDDVFVNEAYLRRHGYKGRVLIDCLIGLLAIAQRHPHSIMVNGGGGDTLFGSLRYIFSYRDDYNNKAAFDAKRCELLNKSDPSGLDSLAAVLATYGSKLIAPFRHPAVIDYFMGKTYAECGGDKKTLFTQEFGEELRRTPYRVFRMSQQIESGIRDLRKQYPHGHPTLLL